MLACPSKPSVRLLKCTSRQVPLLKVTCEVYFPLGGYIVVTAAVREVRYFTLQRIQLKTLLQGSLLVLYCMPGHQASSSWTLDCPDAERCHTTLHQRALTEHLAVHKHYRGAQLIKTCSICRH